MPNKKYLFLILVFFLVSNLQGFQVGIKGSFNFSFLSNVKCLDKNLVVQDITAYRKFKPSLNFGAFARYDMNHWLSLQPEIYFSTKGGTFNVPGTGKLTFQLNYIEVPVILKVRFMTGNPKQSFGVFAGSYFAVKLNSRLHVQESGSGNPEWSADLYAEDDYGLVFGANLDMDLKPGILVLDFRFSLGMKEIDDIGSDVKNSCFSIMLGYGFGDK